MDNYSEAAENIIIIDADYVDSVVFDLTVNFERMLERRVPKADLGVWLDCVALDGGVKSGDNSINVVFVHDKKTLKFDNFQPAVFSEEISGKAFKDHIGEFAMQAVPTEEIAPKEQLFVDILQSALSMKEVKRIIAIPCMDYADEVRMAMRQAEDEKSITILTMQPVAGGNFKQEMLGYSLLQALGIHSEEIETKCK